MSNKDTTADVTPQIGKRVPWKIPVPNYKSFVFDVEEEIDPEDQAKVVIHVTNEEYSYFRFKFVEDANGDYIRKPDEASPFIFGEFANEDGTTDVNQYFRISKTRYNVRPGYKDVGDISTKTMIRLPWLIFEKADNGQFVKIAGSANLVVFYTFPSMQVGDPLMVNLKDRKRYKKVYIHYNKEKCYISRNVTRYIEVPMGFGTHIMSDISYGTKVGNNSKTSGEQTAKILETLRNYNSRKEKVGYGVGTQFKYFSFSSIKKDKNSNDIEEGNYIKEMVSAPDVGNKWSPDSGSTNRASNVNSLPYFTYKAYFYRGDDPKDESVANPLTAIQKMKEDVKNKNRNLAVSEGGNPIIFEIARHTRTNNFCYYKKGGPLPPNNYQGKPAFYEINKIGQRFRVVLREEDYEANFRSTTHGGKVIQKPTTTMPLRDGISFDLYTQSNDLEGCLGILGVLRNGKYTKLAGGEDWDSFNNKLIDIIKELGEVYGKKSPTDIDKRTRVFLKADPLPDVPTIL